MRVTTAFSRLLRLQGVWVTAVRFQSRTVVVDVALRRQRLLCPHCGYSTRARKDMRTKDSYWRHLDLGTWQLEIHARRRRLYCPRHRAVAEGVPFARADCHFTRDFEDLAAWLATRTDKGTIRRLLRIDWDTIGRIIERVSEEKLDGERLNDLFEIGIDEVAWRKGHKYLTLVVDHRRRRVVWGTEGSGSKAADQFFAELDAPSQQPAPPAAPAPAPAQPCACPPDQKAAAEQDIAPPSPPRDHGPHAEPAGPDAPVGPRAGQLRTISLDMGPGYAASARQHAPQAVIAIDPYHVVQLANQALDDVRRDYWNHLRSIGDQQAAKRFKDARWALLKNPENLTEQQAATHRKLRRAGGKVWLAYTLKEAVRGIFEPGLSVEDVTLLLDRLLSRAARSGLEPLVRLGRTIRKHREGILTAVRLGINNARNEALNNKVRLITRRAYGFHSAHAALALVMLACGPINLQPPHELHSPKLTT